MYLYQIRMFNLSKELNEIPLFMLYNKFSCKNNTNILQCSNDRAYYLDFCDIITYYKYNY